MAVRYMQKGTTQIEWLTTLASTTSPTIANVNAGTDLEPQIAEIAGFSFSNTPIATPDMASTFTKSIAGEDVSEDSSMTFYELNTAAGNPILAALTKGLAGWVVIAPFGFTGAGSPKAAVATDVVDVWPCTIASKARQYTASNEAAKVLVKFTPTDVPSIASACV